MVLKNTHTTSSNFDKEAGYYILSKINNIMLYEGREERVRGQTSVEAGQHGIFLLVDIDV